MNTHPVVDETLHLLQGRPVFLAGSLCAAEDYGLPSAWSDVDLFCPTGNVLVSTTEFLLGQNYTMDDRFARVWYRWLRYGFKTWHTNSLRLISPLGVETNLVFKMTEGHATTSLAQVLESFDFGLLAVGYDVETKERRDLRPYLFQGQDPLGPLPMMPNKRDNWRQGFISQYNALREVGRYVKYIGYGYDLSLVKDDLVTGYWEASAHLASRFEPEKQQLGKIYEAIAQHMEMDNLDQLKQASAQIDYNDPLDVIMDALE